MVKSVIFAIGWKGEAQADLEQAKTNTKPTPISKTQITRSNSVRGDFWGMHRIDLKRLDILGFVTVW